MARTRPQLKEAQNIVMGAGYAVFEKEDALGVLEGGELYMGTSKQIGFNVTAETVEIPDEDPPVEETLLEVANKVVRAGQLVLKNVSWENMENFFMGTASTLTQAAGSVTGYLKDVVLAGRSIQLGASLANPTGVRGVSAVAVHSKEGNAAVAWAATTVYAVGDVVVPTVANNHWYMATVAGTSAGAEPTFPTDGSTVADNGITWQDMGVIDYTLTTDYEVEATDARVFITTTGAIATAIALADAIGIKIGLDFDYTTDANSRQQLITGGQAITGALRIITDNSKGLNRDAYMPKVTLVPNGDYSLKSRTEEQTMTFDVKISKRSGYEALYIDGQAA